METSELNQEAWNAGAYEAWVNRFGTPQASALRLRTNPEKRIGHLYKYVGAQVQNKKIMNLMGSHGMKAAALAILGADVTVVDFSDGNRQYAEELAEAADVSLRYILSNVLKLAEEDKVPAYDVVFMENGILHYFNDLKPLFDTAASLLRSGGVFVLQDFHPVSTKLISSRGTKASIRKHKVTGDYFSTSLEEKSVSFHKYLKGDSSLGSHTVYLRNWNLGEIVTSLAASGLCIKELEELPNLSSEVYDRGIPKSFIISAEKL